MTHNTRNPKLYYRLIPLLVFPFVTFLLYVLYLIVAAPEFLQRHIIIISLIVASLIIAFFASLAYLIKMIRGISLLEHMSSNLVLENRLPANALRTTAEISTTIKQLQEWRNNSLRQSEFAEQIVAGNLDITYRPAHAQDKLGHALINLKESLLSIKKEDIQRNWAAEGLAKFVTILQSTQNLKVLSNNIIINLASIIKANQGALFLLEKDELQKDILVLQACYAYNRSKNITHHVRPGEGLIGQVFLEKTTMYLTDVPEHFVRITSGLGEATPRNILIVPLKMNENVIGVLEVASFHTFQKHEIEFTEKISESIAYTITSFRVAEHTKKLLDESQTHAEQMREQEEELRQNQEELEATQEEISRKYDALFKQLGELNYQSKFDQLKSITFTKKRSVEYYFSIIRNQILTFAEDRMIIDAMKAFRHAFYQVEKITDDAISVSLSAYYQDEFIARLNDNINGTASIDQYLPENAHTQTLQYHYIANNPHPTGRKSLLNDARDGSEYSAVHATYHPILRNFLEKFGYYDIFLIDAATGDMVYSVFKEVDFATSLLSGIYQNTNFGVVVKKAIQSQDKNFVSLIDFEPYDPSYHAPASFIACPIYEKEEKIGILVFQMPINKINQILTGDGKWKEDGLGDSGETIIVGNDYKLRSIVRGFIENPTAHLTKLRNLQYDESILRQMKKMETTILFEEMKSAAIDKALRGDAGIAMERDQLNVEMLEAYAPLEIPDVHWVIFSRMEETEASMRINSIRNDKG